MPSPLPLLFLWTMYQKACLNFDHIIWFVDSLSLFKDEPGNYHARKDIPNHHWCMMQVWHIMLIMLYMIFCLRRPFEVPLCFRVHDVEIQFSIVLCLQYRKSKIVNVNSLSHLDSSKNSWKSCCFWSLFSTSKNVIWKKCMHGFRGNLEANVRSLPPW